MDDLPSTREVLGEHLYQKIREVHNDYDGRNGLIDKITGILLERPVEDIFKMLADENYLKHNVKIAVGCAREKRERIRKEEKTQEDCHVIEKGILKPSHISDLSEEEMNQQLYERVCQLDPHFAPHITGMLLELDKGARHILLHDPSRFLCAFEKARSCLPSYEESSMKEIVGKEDDWPHVIYAHAEKMHKDYAPRITGMILELDSKTLGRIMSDKNSLDAAVVKSYNALKDNMCL